MFDFLNGLGDAKTPVMIFAGFMILYIPVMIFIMKQKKDKLNKWLADNPNAVKVYVEYKAGVMKMGSINVHSVDGETPRLFNEGAKVGFYVLPGEHVVESSFIYSRPGVMYKTVTETYGPSKQEIAVEAGKKYDYSFDRKEKAYDFAELQQG